MNSANLVTHCKHGQMRTSQSVHRGVRYTPLSNSWYIEANSSCPPSQQGLDSSGAEKLTVGRELSTATDKLSQQSLEQPQFLIEMLKVVPDVGHWEVG